MSEHSTFSASIRDGVRVVRFARSDVLDQTWVATLQRELLDYAAKTPGGAFVIDLSNVHMLSSAALGTLMALHKQAAASDGRLLLAGAPDAVLEGLRLVNLHKVLKSFDTVDNAVAGAFKR